MFVRRLASLTLAALLGGLVAPAFAQTTTYRLHNEASTTAGLKQLRAAVPDAAATVLQSAALQGTAAGEKVVAQFNTATGVPGTAGRIPIGATISTTVWMRKTANVAAMVPRLKVRLDSATGTLLCTATGTTALTTTLTAYTLTCTTSAVVTLTASSRLYVWAGVNLTTTSSTAFRAELGLEGTAGGNYDSAVTIPNALSAPTITSLTPASGGVGTSVMIAGTNFRDQQLNSTVTFFNNKTATVTSWSNTSVVVTVPTGTTTGAVRVTVAGVASNLSTFTIVPPPSITSLSPTSAAIGAPITITGTNFGATQSSSTVKFNGVNATPTSWSATSIAVPVPSGATTGPLTVTVSGRTSAGMTFTVIPPPTLTSLAPTSGAVGALVTLTGTNFGATRGTSTVHFNGTLAVPTAWSSTSITAPVPPGASSGSIAVTVSSQTSNGLSFDVIQPLALTSVSPSAAAVWSVVTITGTGFGTSQGSSAVTFSGIPAMPSAWSSTAITTRVPASATDGPVVVTVDGIESNGVPFTVAPATPLTVTPSLIKLAVGATQVLSARTDVGQPASGVTWSSSNPAAVSMSPTVAGEVTAVALGEATITAMSGGFTATAIVRVLPSGVNFGEAVWATEPTPGREIAGVFAANPMKDDDPSFFTVEPASDGQSFLVRGIRAADGVNVSSSIATTFFGADKFGGTLTAEGNVSATETQTVRRTGGSTVPSWAYVTGGYVYSAVASEGGVVFLLEADLTSPISGHPLGWYNSQAFVVGLDAVSGQQLFKTPLPTSTDCTSAYTPGFPPFVRTYTAGSFTGMSEMPNGDAAFQWGEHLDIWEGACGSAPTHAFTIRAVRVTSTGVVTSDDLTAYAGQFPRSVGLGAVRPDGFGGVLTTRNEWAFDTQGQFFISRVSNGTVTNRAAPWETIEEWIHGDARIMVTSDGTVILPEGPNGMLVARAVDTWLVKTTLPISGTPVTVLDDGGIVVLANGALHTFQADGILAFSDPTPIATALTTANDDVVYGLDSTTGELEQIMLRPKRRKIWTFLQNLSGCTPGVLLADMPVVDAPHIGLVPRLEPYVYDFKLDNADPTLNVWTTNQQLGVDEAFDLWNDGAPEFTTEGGLTVTFAKWATPGAQVDIWVTKHDFVTENPTRPGVEKVTGRFDGAAALPSRRITGGTVRLSNRLANISSRQGFRRTTLHEAGHSLGLAHWNSTPQQPAGDPYAKVNEKGTVMNSNSGTDDSGGWVADRPTRCDIDAVTLALRR